MKRLAGLIPDLVGLAGYVLVCGGVGVLWGRGWVLIAAGVPLLVAYVWRETRPRGRE
jgi:hypothetical protein